MSRLKRVKRKSLKQYAQKTKNLETKTKMMWQSVTEHDKKRLKYEQYPNMLMKLVYQKNKELSSENTMIMDILKESEMITKML